ncbi:MAG: prolipoprotein diacylglyceryl transferase, partial [Sphaerospermopsis sp. SIO1G2]|nr:prolipoprotein diacylglyceryl transferase [Sphaerospermopsis sp. SIO1G2]
IRAGGVNIIYGFIGASLVGYFYIRYRDIPLWDYADMVGPTLFLAQGIGRWGNFINQELYGPPTTQPWGILIDATSRISPYNDLATYPLETRFHPTFLYESIALLVGFAVLIFLNARYRETLRPGTLFAIFMIWWGGNRAWIELFRPDQPNIGETPLTYSMLGAIGIALVGLYILLNLYEMIPQSERSRRQDLRQKRTPKPKKIRD